MAQVRFSSITVQYGKDDEEVFWEHGDPCIHIKEAAVALTDVEDLIEALYLLKKEIEKNA